MEFRNLIEVSNYFADNTKATEYLVRLRWKNGVVCIHCKHEKVYTLKGENPRFKCAKCRKQFSATKGSIFENSPISLQKWFTGIYLITSHKKGISSHQLAKDLSITQKSSWFMLQRIRFALQSGSFNHSDNSMIQIDETFVGGKEKNKHKSLRERDSLGNKVVIAGPKGKTPVMGMLETNGEVKAEVVKDIRRETLIPIILDNVRPTAIVVTDEHNGYNPLKGLGYKHLSVEHSKDQYVWHGFHTNGIENFWSLFKRGIYGIYHQVSAKHLDKYVDEFEFRFNTRKWGEVQRFNKMLTLVNKRLTYAELIKKEESQTTSGTFDDLPNI